MSSAFLCQCNHIAVPAVIEGSTVLVCRHLLQGSHYRTDPHHLPCSFKLEDTGAEFQPLVRAAVLHRRPRPFSPLPLPAGSDSLDLYKPTKELAASRELAEDVMEIDSMTPLEGAQFVLEQRPAPMDAHAWRKRCLVLERQLRASEDRQRQLEQRLIELQEERRREAQDHKEQLRAAAEQADYYEKKYDGTRTELYNLRRSTRIIVSNALQPQRTSSPSPI